MSTLAETLQQGLDHHRAGRLVQAEQMYRRVLRAHPRHAGAAHLLGLIAYEMGKPDIAAQLIEQAAKFDSFQAQYPADLGEMYRASGKLPEAIAAYRRALEINPAMADAHCNLGALMQQQGDLEAAQNCYREALRLNGADAEAHCRLGSVMQLRGQWNEACAEYEESARLAPERAETYFHWGVCLAEQGNPLSAIACFQQALRLNPQFAEAAYHRGMARLALGEYELGWQDFEARLRCPWLVRRHESLPWWSGEELAGQSILVHAELAAGDTLQFIRYVNDLRERGATVLLDVQEELVDLLKSSGYDNFVTADEARQRCQWQAPLLSLPRILGTTAETIPAAAGYLRAEAQRVSTWRKRLAGYPGFKVAIAWQGDPADRIQQLGSIPLADFAPLAGVPGVTLLSVQTGPGREQMAALGDRFEVIDLADELADGGQLWSNLAAVLSVVDLVVTPEGAIAHLGGGLGAKTWTALAPSADWRWPREGARNPWYDSMRLFRQQRHGAWQDVIEPMAQALAEVMSGR